MSFPSPHGLPGNRVFALSQLPTRPTATPSQPSTHRGTAAQLPLSTAPKRDLAQPRYSSPRGGRIREFPSRRLLGRSGHGPLFWVMAYLLGHEVGVQGGPHPPKTWRWYIPPLERPGAVWLRVLKGIVPTSGRPDKLSHFHPAWPGVAPITDRGPRQPWGKSAPCRGTKTPGLLCPQSQGVSGGSGPAATTIDRPPEN